MCQCQQQQRRYTRKDGEYGGGGQRVPACLAGRNYGNKGYYGSRSVSSAIPNGCARYLGIYASVRALLDIVQVETEGILCAGQAALVQVQSCGPDKTHIYIIEMR